MKLTIIYDNQAYYQGLENKWGFACLVELKDQPVLLFDTGGEGGILLRNMDKLGLDPAMIERVFISHQHWDHIGGLAGLFRKNNKPVLYIPPSAQAAINKMSLCYHKEKIVYVDRALQIEDNLFSTGELKGQEQALIVRTEKGLVVVVGCSHPGVDLILDTASAWGEVYALIGGFHGFDNFEVLKGVQLICPTHCTKYKSEINLLYPEKCIKGGVGRVIEI